MGSLAEPDVILDMNANAGRGLWHAVFDLGVRDGPDPGGRSRGRRLQTLTSEPASSGAPVTARRGGLEVVFAGHLLNSQELHPASGSRPRSEAEIILRGYRDRGEQFLTELRGYFSVLIWDPARETFLAARDQLGVSPLFISQLEDKVVLSSSVDGVLTHPEVPRTLNRLHMVDQLRHAYPDPGETFFLAVRRIMPGHVFRWERGRSEVDRYWDPLPSDQPVAWLSKEDVNAFGDLLDQAVNRCLRIGDSGIFLSGGLDSVSVAAVATDLATRMGLPLPLALSLHFDHPSVDESDVQRSVAASLGLPLVLLRFDETVGDRGLLMSDLELCRTWHAPLLNPWLPAYCRLGSEGVARGRRVILTGGGGDEWLTVGPNYAADMVRAGSVRGVKSVWNMWKRTYQLSNRAMARSLVKYAFWPPAKASAKRALGTVAPKALSAWRGWRSGRTFPQWLAPDAALRREALTRDAERPEERLLFEAERLAYYLTDGRHALDHPAVSMEMEEDHEVGRRLGLVEADPYWDPDLVPFLYRTPPEMLLRGGRGKGLVRSMLSERFPGLGFESQRKMVSLSFFQARMLAEASRAWDEVAGVTTLADLGVVDGMAADAAVRRLVEDQRHGEAYRVWDLLTMEAWARGRA